MTFVQSLRCIDCDREYAAEDLISVCTEDGRQGLGFGLLEPTYDYPRIGEKLNKIVLKKRESSV